METDHESTEEEVSQEISRLVDQYSPKARPKRPRDPEKRRLASRKWAQKDRKASPDRLAKRRVKVFISHEAVKTSTFDSGLLASALRRQWPFRPKLQPVVTPNRINRSKSSLPAARAYYCLSVTTRMRGSEGKGTAVRLIA